MLRTGKNSRAGFTIIEAMVVALIAGIIAAMVIPRLGQTVERMRFVTAGRDLALFFTYAREQSINQGRIYKAVVDQASASYYLEPASADQKKPLADKIASQRRKLPVRPTLSAAAGEGGDKNAFAFYPDGTATSGSVTLTNKQGRCVVVSVDDYGRIELQNR